LRRESASYKEEVTESFERDEYEGVELNLDSLQAFLDKYFPDKYFPDEVTNKDALNNILDEFLSFEVTLKELFESYQKNEKYILRIVEEGYFNRLGILTTIIALTNDEYFKGSSMFSRYYVTNCRKIIAAGEAAKNKSLK
jgi:hypothetical protein